MSRLWRNRELALIALGKLLPEETGAPGSPETRDCEPARCSGRGLEMIDEELADELLEAEFVRRMTEG